MGDLTYLMLLKIIVTTSFTLFMYFNGSPFDNHTSKVARVSRIRRSFSNLHSVPSKILTTIYILLHGKGIPDHGC